ncbi:MAG: T9SS type A sorting domain-containing protein [Bacteroidetes bacterium]|nr:T9SS type A sorting domain-containing protein [Bacteroidota bacterium]
MNRYYLIITCLVAVLTTNAQITIDDADLMNAGDTFRVSFANPNQATAASLATQTGANYTWDFSMLIPVSQDVDTFLSVLNANPIYLLTFSNLGFNPNRANIAKAEGALPALPLPVTLDNPVTFFYKTTANFRSPGTGIEVASLPTAFPYNGDKDSIYLFPLNFNDNDSCSFSGGINIPGLGYYGTAQKRVNLVDGWGVVTTPYGTFDALRIKTILTGKDTLADTSGFGFSIPRARQTKYKWLAKNEGIPVLEITVTTTFGQSAVTEIKYRDNFGPFLSSINQLEFIDGLQAWTANDLLYVRYNLLHASNVSLTIYDAKGARIKQQQFAGNKGEQLLPVAIADMNAGVYIAEIIAGNKKYSTRFQIR